MTDTMDAAVQKMSGDLGRILHSRLQPAEILDAVASAVAARVPRALVVALWEETPGVWHRAARRGGAAVDPASLARLAEYAPVVVRGGGAPANGSSGPDALLADECARRCSVRHAAIVPLATRDRRSGFLLLGGDGPPDEATREWLDLVCLCGSRELERAALQGRLAKAERLARALSGVYETARDISSQLGLEQVLQAIAQRARELVGTSVVLMTLVDAETGELVNRVSVGTFTDIFRGQRIKLTEGFGGQAIRTGKLFYVRDAQSDPHKSPVTDAAILTEGLRSELAAPMYARNRLVGVFYLANRHITEFSDEDEALLVALANIAAVAIDNARLYDEQARALAELREVTALAEQQNALLLRERAIHEQLTQMVLNDSGVAGISGALADLLGNPVVVENQYFQLVARSPNGTGDAPGGAEATAAGGTPRAALADPELRGYLRHLERERRPLPLAALPRLGMPEPRVVAPILAGGEGLGYLTVVERNRKLEKLDLTAIQHGATILALEFMRQRTAFEVADRLQGEFFDDLLTADPRTVPTLIARAAHHGLDLTCPHRLLLITPLVKPGGREVDNRALSRQLAALVRAALADGAPHALVVPRAAEVAVVLPLEGPGPPGKAAAHALAAAILADARIRQFSPEVLVTIGGECRAVQHFSRSLQEASKACAIAASLGWTERVVCFDDLGFYRLLFRMGEPDELRAFADELLLPLIAYDQRHDAELVRTLETYLAQMCRVEATARALHVHNHTVRYRLRRIEEILGRALQDAQLRQDLQMALAVLRLHGER